MDRNATHLLLTVIAIVTIAGQYRSQGTSCKARYSSSYTGSCMPVSTCIGASFPGICTNRPTIVCCIPDSSTGSPPVATHLIVTREVFYNITGESPRTRALYPFYVKALGDAGISTIGETAAFTAQILYETSDMMLSEETTSALQYENSASLGNTQTGDGEKYIGRGFLPLRGRHMYELVGKSINEDLVDAPELAAMPSIGFIVASWLWRHGYQSADGSTPPTGPLSKYANETKYGFAMLSYAIAQDGKILARKRFSFWSKTIKALDLPCPSEGHGPQCIVGNRRGTCLLATTCMGKNVEGICTGPADVECCIECQNPVDLVFIVDSSGSVGQQNFQKALDFVASVSQRFDVSNSYIHGTRIALIRYSSTPAIIYDFRTYRSTAAVVNATKLTWYISGSTYTDLALQMARDQLFGDTLSGVRPGNLGISRILVLLTDGKTTKGTESVREPSEALRTEGVTIFSVGIGSGVKISELNEIASNPDADHVFLSNSYNSVWRISSGVQHASCREPALLDVGKSILLEIDRKAKKFYKYRTDLLEELSILKITPAEGDVRMYLSLRDKNPREKQLELCSINATTAQARKEIFLIREIVNTTFCSGQSSGGMRALRLKRFHQSKIACIKGCSKAYVYVSIEGLKVVNRFNISLVNLTDSGISIKELLWNDRLGESNATFTFPLKSEVYVGSALAVMGTMATIAAYVTLSCAGKTLEIKCSSKLKKKKKEEENQNIQKRGSGLVNGGGGGDEIDTTSPHNQPSRSKPSKPNKHASLVSSMISALKRRRSSSKMELLPKDNGHDNAAFALEGIDVQRSSSDDVVSGQRRTSGNPVCKNNSSIGKGKLKVSSRNIGRNGGSRTERKGSTVKGVGGKEEKDVMRNYEKGRSKNANKSGRELRGVKRDEKGHNIGNTLVHENTTKGNSLECPTFTDTQVRKMSSEDHEKVTRSLNKRSLNDVTTNRSFCCYCGMQLPDMLKFNRKTKEKRSSDTNYERGKPQRFRITKARVLTVACPCFTVFVPEDDTEENEDEQTNREKRFERDMHISQSFCILLAQLIFVVGIHARNSVVGCAFAAIFMNYLYLVAMAWLMLEAYYLYSYAGKTLNDTRSTYRKRVRKYYAAAWGLPLIVVVVTAIKPRNYSKNPHCWIAMTGALDLAVSLPLASIGMVQLLLLLLMLKAIITYKKSTNAEEKDMKKEILKVGLRNIICISLTVLLSWLLGTLSMNIDKGVYQTLFAISSALQGVAFFLCYVIFNKETRQLFLVVKNMILSSKNNTVTPFSEHEQMEIEDEKDKKKDKNTAKSATDSEQRNPGCDDVDTAVGVTAITGVMQNNNDKEPTGKHDHNKHSTALLPIPESSSKHAENQTRSSDTRFGRANISVPVPPVLVVKSEASRRIPKRRLTPLTTQRTTPQDKNIKSRKMESKEAKKTNYNKSVSYVQ